MVLNMQKSLQYVHPLTFWKHSIKEAYIVYLVKNLTVMDWQYSTKSDRMVSQGYQLYICALRGRGSVLKPEIIQHTIIVSWCIWSLRQYSP